MKLLNKALMWLVVAFFLTMVALEDGLIDVSEEDVFDNILWIGPAAFILLVLISAATAIFDLLQTISRKFRREHPLQNVPIVEPEGPTLKDACIPLWVENARFGRWSFIVLGGLASAISQKQWPWLLGVMLFIICDQVIYRKFRKQHPKDAEIAYRNKKDGYFEVGAGGDGDGGD